jgi:hypothetical protein
MDEFILLPQRAKMLNAFGSMITKYHNMLWILIPVGQTVRPKKEECVFPISSCKKIG